MPDSREASLPKSPLDKSPLDKASVDKAPLDNSTFDKSPYDKGSTSSSWLVDVVIDPRAGRFDRVLTYRSNEPLEPGFAVIVPAAKKDAFGYAVACRPVGSEDPTLHRPIQSRVTGLDLPPVMMALAKEISEQTLCSFSSAIGAAVPPGARERLSEVWSLTDAVPFTPRKRTELTLEADDGLQLPPLQAQVLQIMKDAGGTLVDPTEKKLDPGLLRALLALYQKKLVRRELRFIPPSESRSGAALLALTAKADDIEAFIQKEGKKKPAQALALMCLLEASSADAENGENRGAFTASEITALAGVTSSTVRQLVSQGFIAPVTSNAKAAPAAVVPTLNRSQQIAVDAVVASVIERSGQPFLLFGVTGSGKTEVYLRAASEALKAGRQVLYLVPEIALAAQAIVRLRERFGSQTAVLHSELTPLERIESFHRIRDHQAAIVIGARSALFAPLDNLGLIVVDEEHEGAYKQEVEPRYHAVKAALALGRLHSCPVVLGSATPSVESFYEAESGRLTLLSLPHRAADAKLPEVFLEDLADGFRAGAPSILTPHLADLLKETIEAGDQAILFLNRRAFAPFLLCRDCGEQWMCPRCSVTLSFHKAQGQLRCHHCGHTERPPDICKNCGGTRIAPLGVGTERVEQEVASVFPGVTIGRLDRDVAAKKGSLESVLTAFRSGETQVLVGTQMVAKGLDFPRVTLVGVIAADVSLCLPDFRASERTFQLLSQVAGRAGRGTRPGRVVIQTFRPGHPSVQAAQSHDYVKFYELLRQEREEAGYPPYRRLINAVISGESRPDVVNAAEALADSLRPFGEVLGPADCVLERLRNRWRRHLLLKLGDEVELAAVREAIPRFPPKGVSMVIDVDPYSLM